MNEFSIILPDGGDIHFLADLPDSLKQIRMPFAEMATAISHNSKMAFQHIQGDGFDLWWSKYSASENVKVIGTSDMAIIELHMALRNHFKSNWDGIGEPSMRALQFNFSYAPYINSTSWFIAGQQYETFDFHFTKAMLEPYAAVYPDLEAFLGKVEKREMAHLSVDCVLTRKMQSLLGEMRAFRCRSGIYLKTLKAMVETLLTLALEELSNTKPFKKLAITPLLIEKARQAKAILDSRLSDPPSIEELARLCISNVYSIQVAFKHCFGTTIHDYSLDARLEYAKGLLLDTKLNLNTIADEVGFGEAFAFNQTDNQAYSAKLDYSIPATHSTFNLFYREMGANFQSYTLFSTGSRQTNWGIKWRQVLFKNQLTMTAQLKKSSFDDPLISSTFSSTVLLKSLQLVWRRKKWPIISLAYMPTSQLMKDASGNVIENVYYALTGTAVYSYSVKKVRMSSSVMYSQFYNRGTDSGFVLYNAKSIMYTHQVFLGAVNLQTDVQYNEQPSLEYWMWQQGINIRIGKSVTVGGSLKNDLVPGNGSQYWGGMLQGQINFKKLGGIRLQYSKDYIPNGTGSLVPYNWGRANWIKVF